MSDSTGTVASSTTLVVPEHTMTGTSVVAQQPPAAQTYEDPTKPPAWLGPRLEEAKNSATRALLKQLGFDKPEDLKERLAKAKELEDAQLTEQQRVAKELESLKHQASEAARYKQISSDLAELQFKSLTPAEQAALEDLSPLDRLPFITRFVRARQAPVAAVGTDTQQASPTISPVTPPAHNAPPGTPPPPAGSQETAFDRWQKLPAGSTAAAVFYRAHQAEIDASRK